MYEGEMPTSAPHSTMLAVSVSVGQSGTPESRTGPMSSGPRYEAGMSQLTLARDHAVGDGVPDRDRHVPGRAGIADARHARPEDLARVVDRSHRAPLRATVHVDLLGAAPLAVGQMTVRVDEARQHRLAAGVEDLPGAGGAGGAVRTMPDG